MEEALTGNLLEHRVAHEALEAFGIEARPVHRHGVLQSTRDGGGLGVWVKAENLFPRPRPQQKGRTHKGNETQRH